MKMHLKEWGFTKNKKSSSRRLSLGLRTQLPRSLLISMSTVSFSGQRPTAPTAEEQTLTSNVAHAIQPLNITHGEEDRVGDHQQYARQAGAAFIRKLEASAEGVQSDLTIEYLPLLWGWYHRVCEQFPPDAPLWRSHLESGNADELRLHLDTMYLYAERLEPSNANLWHTATLVGFHSVHIFREASRIVRIFPTAMRQLPAQLQHLVCYQFLSKFLEFEGGVLDFPISNKSATDVQHLCLVLQLAMQKPVMIIEHHVMRFTATLCKMMDSFVKQLHSDDGEGLADNDSNMALVKELKLPTNNLPHKEQMTPIGLAFQLQFFVWLYHTVNWDYPGSNINVEHLLVTIVEHLISIAIVIAKRNRSEKRTQTREHLSAFAFKMSVALPVILDPKHCCWSMPHICDDDDSWKLFIDCGGRCMRYLKIFNYFEYFCRDGLESLDFSEHEDIRSKLSKETTYFKDWATKLSSEMKCPSQWWSDPSLGLETGRED